MMLTGDKKPVWRRMLLIRTYKQFEEPDKDGNIPEGCKPIDTSLKYKLAKDEEGLDWLFTESVKSFRKVIKNGNFTYTPTIQEIEEKHEKYSLPADWIIEQVCDYDPTENEPVDLVITKAMEYYESQGNDIFQDLDHKHFLNSLKNNRKIQLKKIQIGPHTTYEAVVGLKLKDSKRNYDEYREMLKLESGALYRLIDFYNPKAVKECLDIKEFIGSNVPESIIKKKYNWLDEIGEDLTWIKVE